LQKNRHDHNLPVLKHSPRLTIIGLKTLNFMTWPKPPNNRKTLRAKRCACDRWLKHLGALQLNEITRVHLNTFIAK
jgi:hypothetical protein